MCFGSVYFILETGMVSIKQPVGQTEHHGWLKNSDKTTTAAPNRIIPIPIILNEKNMKGSI